jgi:hypothetical protein
MIFSSLSQGFFRNQRENAGSTEGLSGLTMNSMTWPSLRALYSPIFRGLSPLSFRAPGKIVLRRARLLSPRGSLPSRPALAKWQGLTLSGCRSRFWM